MLLWIQNEYTDAKNDLVKIFFLLILTKTDLNTA